MRRRHVLSLLTGRQERARDRVRVLSESLKGHPVKVIHLIAALGLTIAFGARAQTAPASAADHAAHHATAVAPTTEGEVRKIDKEQGKVTLKHGPITNLDMPGMTMVFRVADPTMLASIKEGDKVKFAADRVNGAITVTAIESVR